MNKLFMPIEHNGVVAGYVADGYGLNSKQMRFAEGVSVAHSCYNNKRSFSVHTGEDLVGTVHYMSGGRYVGLDNNKNEICSYVGQDAEVKCFVEVAKYSTSKVKNSSPDEYVSSGYAARWHVSSSTGYPD